MSHEDDVRLVRRLPDTLGDWTQPELDALDRTLARYEALMAEHVAERAWRHAKQDDGSPVLPWIIEDAHDNAERVISYFPSDGEILTTVK